jgi:hypothetical protein
MIKELLKYLLPLCILLVDGYSNMYAGLQQAPACASPIHVLAKSEHPKLARPADDRGLVFRLPDAAKKFCFFVKTISV